MQKAFLLLEQGIGKACLITGEIALIGMAGLIFVEVIGRYVFKHSFGVSEEISGYLFVVLIFLGLGYVTSRDAHIKVQIVTSRLSPRAYNRLQVVTLLLFLLFAGIFTKLGYDFVLYNYGYGTRSIYISHTPQWIPMSSIAVGFGLTSLVLLLRFIRCFGAGRGQ